MSALALSQPETHDDSDLFSLEKLGRLAVEASADIGEWLNERTGDLGGVREFFDLARESPLLYVLPPVDPGVSMLTGDGTGGAETSHPQLAIANLPPFRDVLDKPISKDDDEATWIARWRLCTEVHRLAVTHSALSGEFRNTWLTDRMISG